MISARVNYACVAMIELADRYSVSEPTKLTDITEKHGIPHRFLVQILLQLKAAGLVKTIRGANGGYRLAQEPSKITVAEIVGALESAQSTADRIVADPVISDLLARVWKQVSVSRTNILQQFKLSDLVPQNYISDYVI